MGSDVTVRCQDFVIKDGRFIGAVEEMNRRCRGPWNQDQDAEYYPTSGIALLDVARLRPAHILDLGCGTGRFTERVRAATGARVTALDVSQRAGARAGRTYHGIKFARADMAPIPLGSSSCDLVVASELLWYVLPRLRQLFGEVRRVLTPRGKFLITQSFYRRGRQQLGPM